MLAALEWQGQCTQVFAGRSSFLPTAETTITASGSHSLILKGMKKWQSHAARSVVALAPARAVFRMIHCFILKSGGNSPVWERLPQAVLWKNRSPFPF